MATEVSNLIIKVSSDDVASADKRLSHLTETAGRTERATDKLIDTVKELALAYVSIEGAVKAFEKLYEVSKEFQVLEAQIRTAIGTTEHAHEAFLALQELAGQTPFTLREVTSAFTDLVNKGLDPSEKALRSYGNIAAAMNLSLETVTGSIIAASSGMYRGLLAIGIKVKEVNDGLVLTYHGTSTKIRKDSADIESYVQSLGNTHFLNAMTERAGTLEGATVRLHKAWDELFISISERGAGNAIKESIILATEALDNLTAAVASGELAGYINALMFKFSSLTDGIEIGFAALTEVIQDAFKFWATDGAHTADFISGAFKNMPENIRAAVQLLGATVGGVMTLHETVVSAFIHLWVDGFHLFVDLAAAAGKAGFEALVNPLASKDAIVGFTTTATAAFAKFGTLAKGEVTHVVQAVGNIKSAWEETVVATLNERDAAISSFSLQIGAADALRKRYDELQVAKKKAAENKDVLGQFKPPTGNTHINSPADIAAFEALKAQLQLEEVTVKESYERRLDLIKNNTEAGSALQIELTKSLNERQSAELMHAQEQTQKRLEDRYKAEQTITQAAYDEKQISEEAYLAQSKANWAHYVTDITKLTSTGANVVATKQLQMYSTVLDLAGNISTQLGNLANENSAAAKALFVASKAIAIAQAIVYTELAATRALAEGGLFMGIPMATVIRALGYASVGIMAASSVAEYGGKFEHGGMIGAGKYGITQEAGFEIVKGPAIVQSARSTADNMKSGEGNRGEAVIININNYTDAEATVTKRESNQGVAYDVIIRQVGRAIRTGGNEASRAFEEVYGARRGAA